MTTPATIRISTYEEKHAVAAVAMWRKSKEMALGIKEVHSFENHLRFLQETLLTENDVYLALADEEAVVGIMATNGTFLNQLYIHSEFQGQGIGTGLLELAKSTSSGKLRLYTFEVNLGAQAFYEKHGFSIVSRGADNEEQLPDILYEWRDNEPGAT